MASGFSLFCLLFAIVEFMGWTELLERYLDNQRLKLTRVLWRFARYMNMDLSASGGDAQPQHDDDPVIVKVITYAGGIAALVFLAWLVLVPAGLIIAGVEIDDTPVILQHVFNLALLVIGCSIGLLLALVIAVPVLLVVVWFLHVINLPPKGTVGSIALAMAVIGFLYGG